MAFSLNNGGAGRSRFRGVSTLSEINIIPLVDVVMVLLVIFMLSAHVMEFGLEVDVPKVKTVRDSAQEMPVVSISKDGELYLNEKPVNINDLPDQIRTRFGTPKGAYVRADKAAVWDVVAQVIAGLGDAKIPVNVVTQPEDVADKKKRP